MNRAKVEILTIGNELLLGLQTNGHLTYLGERLSRHGITLARNVVVNDNEVSIGDEFRECWRRGDIVITTGGLGATSDDITRDCVAQALGLKMVYDEAIEQHVQAFFERRGSTMPAINRRIAHRPETAEVLTNRLGSAPGLWIEKEGKVAILLPGPPSELHDVFQEEVIPRLRRRGLLGEEEAYVQLRTAGLGETRLAEKVIPVLERVEGLEIGYCPHEGLVDLRLGSPDGAVSREKLRELATRCADLLGEDLLCFGHDTLEHVVFEQLRSRELTLGLAESCTGGMLANRFTDIPGSSKVFLGGVVCYSNDAKVQTLDIPECFIGQHGAVSAEVAVAMATGVAEKLGAHYALSITGFAGPGGGTADDPVGTVYIGLHTPDGAWSRKEHFHGGRVAVRKRAVNTALDWLRRVVIKHNVGGGMAEKILG